MAAPTKYYVDSIDGDNANGGTGTGDAYADVEYAVDNLTWDASDGVILYVRGTHTMTRTWDTTIGSVVPAIDAHLALVAYDMIDAVFTEPTNDRTEITARFNFPSGMGMGITHYTDMRGIIFDSNTGGAHGVAHHYASIENCEFINADGLVDLIRSEMSNSKVTSNGSGYYALRLNTSASVRDSEIVSSTASGGVLANVNGTTVRGMTIRVKADGYGIDIGTSLISIVIENCSVHCDDAVVSTKAGINLRGWGNAAKNNVVSGFSTGISDNLASSSRRSLSVRNNSVYPQSGGTAFDLSYCSLPETGNEELGSAPFVDPENDDWSTNDVGSISGGSFPHGRDRGAVHASASGGSSINRGIMTGGRL